MSRFQPSPEALARIPGLNRLTGFPVHRILVFGIDLDRSRTAAPLLAALPGARIVSLSDRAAGSYPRAPRHPLAAFGNLLAIQGRAIVVAQDFRKLRLAALALPAALRLVYTPRGLVSLERPRLPRPAAIAGAARQLGRGLLARAAGAPAPLGEGNDYGFIGERRARLTEGWPRLRASVVVPVYNRRRMLERTLACLAHQTYPKHLFEVIVADDGSTDRPETLVEGYGDRLEIRIVRQEDRGYRLAAVRNLGIRAATGDVIVSLDCDMLTAPGFLAAHMAWYHAVEAPLCVFGLRAFVDADGLEAASIDRHPSVVERLPRVQANSTIRMADAPHADWREPLVASTRRLRDEPVPYAAATGGNVSYRRRDAISIGLWDEAFERWGGEDTEFGFRLEQRGAYFIPEAGALTYHQDHPESVPREEDRNVTRVLLGHKVPSFRSPGDTTWEVPRASVCIPACEAAALIERAIENALTQTLPDLEVCVCDDGSTDETRAILERRYRNHRRVRWIHQTRQGIAAAWRRAIELARAPYLLLLAPDDELIPEATERLAEVLESDARLALVYGGHERYEDGRLVRVEVPHPVAPRLAFAGLVPTRPRMVRRRDYERAGGLDVSLGDAADLDLALRLAGRGHVRAVPAVLSRRHVPSAGASAGDRSAEPQGHLAAVGAALARHGLDRVALVERGPDGEPRIRLDLWRGVARRLLGRSRR